MPTPTPDEIRDAAAQSAAEGVASAQGDQGSVTAMDPEKVLRVADRLAGRAAAAGTNANGGPRSGWGMCRNARAVPPGAT